MDYSYIQIRNRLLFIRLLFLFDSTSIQALDLVDHKCISHIVSPSGRELYKVERSASEFHICLKNSNYCTCPAFTFHGKKTVQWAIYEGGCAKWVIVALFIDLKVFSRITGLLITINNISNQVILYKFLILF